MDTPTLSVAVQVIVCDEPIFQALAAVGSGQGRRSDASPSVIVKFAFEASFPTFPLGSRASTRTRTVVRHRRRRHRPDERCSVFAIAVAITFGYVVPPSVE